MARREPRRGRKMGHVTCLGASARRRARDGARDQARARHSRRRRALSDDRVAPACAAPRCRPLAGHPRARPDAAPAGPGAARSTLPISAPTSIKVEDTGAGDYARNLGNRPGTVSAFYRAVNRNKRSMRARPQATRGDATRSSRSRSGAPMSSSRASARASSRRSASTTTRSRRINPRIVYAAISGYGQSGPRAHLAGHDINYLGYAGVLDQTGGRDGPPHYANLQIADLLGGAASTARSRCSRRSSARSGPAAGATSTWR